MSPTVQVYILPTGSFYVPDDLIFADGDWNDVENLPAVILPLLPIIEPTVPEDASDILQRGPVGPDQIDMAIFSHLHFDHTGDISKFPTARILVGPGSCDAVWPGFPQDPTSSIDGAILVHPGFTEVQYSKLDEKRLPTNCPFTQGYDVFGDGSFIALDAPGHMAGHQMGLARTSDEEWAVMGGDCCHHAALLAGGTRDISERCVPGFPTAFHSDPVMARETSRKTRLLRGMDGVRDNFYEQTSYTLIYRSSTHYATTLLFWARKRRVA